MSRRLLEYLNQGRVPLFSKWLDAIVGEPRIAWYPSAGLDFAPLFYLSESFKALKPQYQIPDPPQIFLFTDIWLDGYFNNLTAGDEHHELPNQNYAEEYPPGKLGALKRIIDTKTAQGPIDTKFFYNGKRAVFEYSHEPEELPELEGLGRAWFLTLKVHILGEAVFEQPLIYVFADNASFCSQVLFEKQASITHLWYKTGMGAHDYWLGYVLKRLQTQVLFTRANMGYPGEGPLGSDIGLFNPNENLFPNESPMHTQTTLLGNAEDVPNISEWNDFGDGWYTKKIPLG